MSASAVTAFCSTAGLNRKHSAATSAAGRDTRGLTRPHISSAPANSAATVGSRTLICETPPNGQEIAAAIHDCMTGRSIQRAPNRSGTYQGLPDSASLASAAVRPSS